MADGDITLGELGRKVDDLRADFRRMSDRFVSNERYIADQARDADWKARSIEAAAAMKEDQEDLVKSRRQIWLTIVGVGGGIIAALGGALAAGPHL